MPVITSIKPQKGKDRVNIYVDDEFSFGLDLENFVKLKLKVEKEISEEDIRKIKDLSNKTKILNKLLKFASSRPHSEKEINDYLKRKKIDDNLKDFLFEKLKYFNLLNDQEFAKWWVEQRQSFSPKSKKILSYELKIKGIKQEIVNDILGEVKIDEVGIARDLINKKMYKWEKYDEKTKKQK